MVIMKLNCDLSRLLCMTFFLRKSKEGSKIKKYLHRTDAMSCS